MLYKLLKTEFHLKYYYFKVKFFLNNKVFKEHFLEDSFLFKCCFHPVDDLSLVSKFLLILSQDIVFKVAGMQV